MVLGFKWSLAVAEESRERLSDVLDGARRLKLNDEAITALRDTFEPAMRSEPIPTTSGSDSVAPSESPASESGVSSAAEGPSSASVEQSGMGGSASLVGSNRERIALGAIVAMLLGGTLMFWRRRKAVAALAPTDPRNTQLEHASAHPPTGVRQ